MPYVNVIIPDLSDAELVDRQLTLADPLGLPNVAETAPAEDATLTYVGQYQTTEYIRCALGHLHKKGYAFQGEEGQHYLIGHVCGRNDFGMGAWEHFADDRKRMEDRIYYLQAVRDLDRTFRDSREWFARLPSHPATVWLDTTQNALAEHSRMFNAVQRLIEKGEPTLFVHGVERDFEAEERLREKAVRAGRPLAVVPRVDRPVAKAIGVLQGGALFTKRRLFGREMTRTSAAISTFLDRGAADLSTHQLRELTDAGKAILRSVADLKEAAVGAAAFFAPANLVNFAAWANAKRFDETRWVARGDVLDAIDDWDRVRGRFMPPAAHFDLEEIDRLTERGAGWAARIEAAAGQDKPARRRKGKRA